jgi:hypothetical protein
MAPVRTLCDPLNNPSHRNTLLVNLEEGTVENAKSVEGRLDVADYRGYLNVQGITAYFNASGEDLRIWHVLCG